LFHVVTQLLLDPAVLSYAPGETESAQLEEHISLWTYGDKSKTNPLDIIS
jgi:hypothetical protein